VKVVIEVGHEAFGPPGPQDPPGQSNSLCGDPAAGGRSDVDGLVKEIDAGGWVAEAKARESEVGADDAALDGVP